MSEKSFTVFPKPQFFEDGTMRKKLTEYREIIVPDKEFIKAGRLLQRFLYLFYGYNVPLVKKSQNGICICRDSQIVSGGYRLEQDSDTVCIFASDINGAVSGVSTLIQIIDENLEVCLKTVEDSPNKPIRGMHLYLPPRDKIKTFQCLMDVLALLKMNTIILEVGAGMQYDRRPEINTTWEKFCADVDNFPGVGGSRALQGSDIYWKDSVHTELAGGSYLSKDEVRGLVQYAKDLGIEVIPEIQALSHAYYLTLPYRQIAEVEHDHYPDTYCPLNDESYEIYFDVAEEVLEVFEPSVVSVGHDEIRILGQCPKCREKTGAELLLHDLNKLYEFYSARGIRMAMWGESLQHFTSFAGAELGAGHDVVNKYGHHYTMPAMHQAIESVPKDILMLDWYYKLYKETEKIFIDRDIQLIFGNFLGGLFGNWDVRSKDPHVLGAEVSTWCTVDEKTFAEDGIFYQLAYSAALLWERDCDNESFNEINRAIMNVMPYLRTIMRGKKALSDQLTEGKRLFVGSEEKSVASVRIDKAKIENHKIEKLISCLGEQLYGEPIDRSLIRVKPERKVNGLLFVHGALKEEPFIPSHQFPHLENRGLGAYTILYEDGSLERIGLYYGGEVGSMDFRLTRSLPEVAVKDDTIDDDVEGKGAEKNESPCYVLQSPWTGSLLYQTTPVLGEETSCFVYEWENPFPDKKIMEIKALNTKPELEQAVVLFGIAAI